MPIWNVARSPVLLAYFLQQVKANNKSVTLRLAPLAYNNAYKKFVGQRCNVFRLILHSWRLRSHSWLNFQMKPVLRWTVFWFALVWFAHSTHCSWSTTSREIQLCDTLTLVPWIKQILRRYEQPSEFSEFPWHIWRHIRQQNRSFSPPTADHLRKQPCEG